MSRAKAFILPGVMLFLYFAVTGVPNPHDGFTELTIQAFNDASYSFGSEKWMFFYCSKETQLLARRLWKALSNLS
jgi:hypothetical protein